MPAYESIPIETDPDAITSAALDHLASRVENFDPKEAHLEVALIEVISRINSETRLLGKDVPDAIWRTFGQSLVNVAPIERAHATTISTWTMIDPAGYTLHDGTTVAFRVAGDELRSFRVVGDYIIQPGNTVVSEIPLRAVAAGEGENGLGPGPMEMVDALSYVRSVEAARVTSGGRDPETEDAYMDRLRDEMTLLTPRFVLASDAAVLARKVSGVHRALGIDNWNPETETFGNEKTITVAVVDEKGNSIGADLKERVRQYLIQMREINFVIYVSDPTYTTVNVNFAVRAYPGFDLSDIVQRCRAAVAAYLSPGSWAGGSESPPTWRKEDNVVRYLEVAQRLNEVDGVHYISLLTVNSNTIDVPLAGVAPLPVLGTNTGRATNG